MVDAIDGNEIITDCFSVDWEETSSADERVRKGHLSSGLSSFLAHNNLDIASLLSLINCHLEEHDLIQLIVEKLQKLGLDKSDFFSSEESDFSAYYNIDFNSLSPALEFAIGDPHLAHLIQEKLQELGLDNFEKYLGRGAFGVVVQLEGSDDFEGKKLALKLLPYYPSNNDSSSNSSWLQTNVITHNGVHGDALAMNLPQGHHLNRAYALLTYDGREVHYLKEIDPQLHAHHTVIGIFSRAIQGGTLSERVSKLPLSAEAVRGYGKQLAEALLGLHQFGYLHGDLHGGNVLIKEEAEGKVPHRVKLNDFGLAYPLNSQNDTVRDWKAFGKLLSGMATQTSLQNDLHLEDLLYNPSKGLLVAKNCYKEEEIIHHQFFRI